jgi:hypothetical protein
MTKTSPLVVSTATMEALAGLEQGIVTLHNKVYCPGFFKLPHVKRKFNDWKRRIARLSCGISFEARSLL